MNLNLPDPITVARAEAEHLRVARHQLIEWPVEQLRITTPQVDPRSLLAGLTAFHRERMAKIPSPVTYPESPPWVEQILAVDRELQRLAGLSDDEMAIYRSLNYYLMFRGFRLARPVTVEKCRSAYFPETDRGELLIRNNDDPDTFWEPEPPLRAADWQAPTGNFLVIDGANSGLHINDEPAEIFPLPAVQMCAQYCDDVPGGVQFLTRYSPFWGHANYILHDAQQRSVAIEKCSFKFIEVFPPDATGRSWCSGMACRDPQSPQGRYQQRKRREYLDRFHLPDDGPDATFWRACDQAEQKLAALMKKPGPVTVAEAFQLFTAPHPDGLCKNAVKFHPEQAIAEYTLFTRAILSTPTGRTVYRWQRGPKPGLEWPREPEVLDVPRHQPPSRAA